MSDPRVSRDWQSPFADENRFSHTSCDLPELARSEVCALGGIRTPNLLIRRPIPAVQDVSSGAAATL
jgi:hypothetical protein